MLIFAGVERGFAQESSADFTFKRVKVEDRPIGSRINIQISPEDQQAAVAPASKEEAPTAPADLQDWFWADVSPELGKGDGDRMSVAVAQLRKSPNSKFASADITQMRALAKTYGKEILLGSLGKRVSPAFILAVIGVESSGRADAVSSAGAQGLMQLIPATAERFGVTDPNDPLQNITGGAAYLDWLLKEFSGDPLMALAGYNAGENAVKKHNGVPPYAETRAYIPKVAAAWQVARTLCKTPPKYVSDGCVFQN